MVERRAGPPRFEWVVVAVGLLAIFIQAALFVALAVAATRWLWNNA